MPNLEHLESQFHAWIQAMPKTSVAIGLFLLAARTRNSEMFAATAVYLSRDFGGCAFGEWMVEELEPLLTPDEYAWIWSQIDQDFANTQWKNHENK